MVVEDSIQQRRAPFDYVAISLDFLTCAGFLLCLTGLGISDDTRSSVSVFAAYIIAIDFFGSIYAFWFMGALVKNAGCIAWLSMGSYVILAAFIGLMGEFHVLVVLVGLTLRTLLSAWSRKGKKSAWNETVGHMARIVYATMLAGILGMVPYSLFGWSTDTLALTVATAYFGSLGVFHIYDPWKWVRGSDSSGSA